MSDQITNVHQEADGTFEFTFLFDAGNGITGSTYVDIPPSTDPSNPYTLEQARDLAVSKASDLKTAWLASITSTQVVGNVTL